MVRQRFLKRKLILQERRVTYTASQSASYPAAHVLIAEKAISVSTSYMYASQVTYEPRYTANRLIKVLLNVLKAPEHLQYQLAFLSSVSPKDPESYIARYSQRPHHEGIARDIRWRSGTCVVRDVCLFRSTFQSQRSLR